MPRPFRPAQRRSATAAVIRSTRAIPPAIVMIPPTLATLILTVRQVARRITSRPAGSLLATITMTNTSLPIPNLRKITTVNNHRLTTSSRLTMTSSTSHQRLVSHKMAALAARVVSNNLPSLSKPSKNKIIKKGVAKSVVRVIIIGNRRISQVMTSYQGVGAMAGSTVGAIHHVDTTFLDY